MNAITFSDIRKGSQIMVRGGFGNDVPRPATVQGLIPNIKKHGQGGIDYFFTPSGQVYWAYLDQIDEVLEY